MNRFELRWRFNEDLRRDELKLNEHWVLGWLKTGVNWTVGCSEISSITFHGTCPEVTTKVYNEVRESLIRLADQLRGEDAKV